MNKQKLEIEEIISGYQCPESLDSPQCVKEMNCEECLIKVKRNVATAVMKWHREEMVRELEELVKKEFCFNDYNMETKKWDVKKGIEISHIQHRIELLRKGVGK